MKTKNKGGRPREYEPAEIITFYAQGLTQTEIASRLGCNWRTVHRAIISKHIVGLDKTSKV